MAPRQRFIWPSLWTDHALGRLKPDAMLLYVGCFSNADDEGRLLGDPAYLRATIFPYQDFTLRKVQQLRDAVTAASKSLTLYTVDGVEYLSFRNWGDFQKPKYPKPSAIPSPPEEKASGKPSGKKEETLPKAFPDSAPRVGLGREGSDRAGKEDPGRPFAQQDAATVRDIVARELGGAA